MKRVYFVQAGMSYGSAYYLPYATGCLAAYAWQFDNIKNNYELCDFLYRRDSIDIALKKIINPSVVAFSCYTWTYEYNKTLAQKVKEIYPDCTIIFGGHNISENNGISDAFRFVDYFIYGEGEHPFKEILEYLNGEKKLCEIKNISYWTDKELHINPREYYDSLEDYPSPYLTGLFEKIIKNDPDTEYCAVLETNRGCPYNCAYCDWCYTVDIRQFPIEKIRGEIIWCSRHKVEYIFCADSNFGILKRDYEIAKFVAVVKRQNGYPHIFNTCFAKNSNETVFRISKLFYDNRLNKAATLAYQSVDKKTLENVNRKNFTLEAFSDLVKKYNQNHIPTYTEMILGLPGETYDSFCNGLCDLIDAGQQSALTVYYCQVYCNSLMGTKEYREKFGIKTAHVPLNYLHSSVPQEKDIIEYTDLIVGTKDMPFEDIIKSIIFCTCLQCFHHIGLLKYFAVYVNKELHIQYRSFYDSLLDYIFSFKGSFIYSLFNRIKKDCSDFSFGEWSYYDKRFGNIGWFLEEGAFMEIIYNYDQFWKEITPFLNKFNIEKEIFDELVKYQKFVIRLPGQERPEETFKYNFYEYFDNVVTEYKPLCCKTNKIKVIITNPVYNWEDYARKVMLFAKRRGDTLITNDKRCVEITFEE